MSGGEDGDELIFRQAAEGSAGGSGPEAVVLAGGERLEEIPGGFCRLRGDQGKADAVEAGDAARGGGPQVAISGLGE